VSDLASGGGKLGAVAGTAINIQAARNKLRQAELLYAHLGTMPAQIARDMRRAGDRDYRLPLETFFFACLGAARSVFYILARTGGPQFKAASSAWRDGLSQAERETFNRMLHLPGRDVHYGDVDAMALPKMIEADELGEMAMHVHHNAALFGPAPFAEHVNPDGTKVRARGLQGSMGLYIEIGGLKCEATTACAQFIDQLRSLLAAAERWASTAQPAAAAQATATP
jgi:hypothetical protein